MLTSESLVNCEINTWRVQSLIPSIQSGETKHTARQQTLYPPVLSCFLAQDVHCNSRKYLGTVNRYLYTHHFPQSSLTKCKYLFFSAYGEREKVFLWPVWLSTFLHTMSFLPMSVSRGSKPCSQAEGFYHQLAF